MRPACSTSRKRQKLCDKPSSRDHGSATPNGEVIQCGKGPPFLLALTWRRCGRTFLWERATGVATCTPSIMY
jgi:hypothetical protein